MSMACLTGSPSRRLRRPKAAAPLAQTALISDLMTELGVSARALRYWESSGLLTAGRTSGMARRYDVVQVERARLICDLRSFGMSVRDVKRLLDKGLSTRETRREIIEFLTVRAAAFQAEAERLKCMITIYERG